MMGLLSRLKTLASPAASKGDRQAAVGHHPVFGHFTPYEGNPGDLVVCAMGGLTRPEFIGLAPPETGHVRQAWQEPCEEYFEWIDLLEAVRAARGRFTMLELGAGFGRWTVRGALAARQRGIRRLRLGLAEAEPQHAQWLRQHMADNGLRPQDYRLYEAAVSDTAGETVFCVANAGEDGAWYGQSIVGGGLGNFPVVGDYFGQPLTEFPGGARVITVPMVPLGEILDDYDFIDFIDFDLQGAEADAIESALPALTAKARRLHIGTHSQAIEARLRGLLPKAGWQCLRDYGCLSQNETDYGSHWFNDGIQTWVNPRL